MRVPSGRLTLAAACCAAAVAMPAAVARAGSTGAALTTGAGTGRGSTAPVRLTTHPAHPAHPARPAPADTHTPRHRAAHRHRHRHRLRHARGARDRANDLAGRVTAHAAGDPGVTIADFHFSPATTTIHVGDSITWSNSGPSSHTATASNGSFNTGILKKGQSASHTFTQPGTFAYVCQIHPFMHGTITVLAATTSTTTSATTTTPAATATTPTATTAGTSTPLTPALPNTGFNALGGVCAGLVLLGMGTALRRTRPR